MRSPIPSLLLVVVSAPLFGQPPNPQAALAEYIISNYTKYEFQIPMRDGKKLFTSVYTPKDTTQSYPIMLNRTPYGVAPYGVDKYRRTLGPSEKFVKEGFIFAFQDVRGRYMSEGIHLEMTPHKESKGPADVDESTDTYDTIDWLVKNLPNNNGKVGTYGTSYPGFYTAAGIINAHPAHKAASPQAPMTDLYMGDDTYHGGALMLAANFGFYAMFAKRGEEPATPETLKPFDYKTPDAYDFYLRTGPLANFNEKHLKNKNPYWTDVVKHDTYDEFWKSRNLAVHLKDIKPAVMTVGGWFDAEDLAGPLTVYRAIERSSPGANNMLVMGPWSHGGWNRGDGDKLGYANFASKTSQFFRENIEFPFFNFYLKGKGDGKLPEAYVFETGTNVWRRYDAWPPKTAAQQTLYFHPQGKLSFQAPGEDGFDEYVSDPNKPVPFIGFPAPGVPREYMTADQRFASTRTDVLVYQTDDLTQDVTIAGPIGVNLHVSSTGTDSDFVVKVIDVYPGDFPDPDPNPTNIHMGGYQQLVRGEPFRGKFRNSFEKPEPFAPGKTTDIKFEMPDVLHTFRKGHRIMVQVQSSWFPLVDRNPQKFMNIPDAKVPDFIKATERISRSRNAPSGIVVNVVKGL